MSHLFDIPYILNTFGYSGTFIIIFLESSLIFPLPGDSLLFTGGLFSATIGLNIYLFIGLVFLATFLGGLTGYEVGVHIVRLQNFSFFKQILKEKYINKAHDFFEKYGKMAILFCRFVPIVRTFTSVVAGVGRMDYFSFVKYTFFGSLLWSLVVTLAGYFLGRIFPGLGEHLSFIIVIVVLISILPMIPEMMRKKHRTN